MNQSITVPVADECEHRECDAHPEFAYVVTGDSGTDGVAVYCDYHSETFADSSDHHTALATVSAEGINQ